MSSNLSLSTFSHSSLNPAGAQQYGLTDTGPRPYPPSSSLSSPDGGGIGGREIKLISLYLPKEEDLSSSQHSPFLRLSEGEGLDDLDEDIFLETAFERLCYDFPVKKSDLDSVRHRLTRYDDVVALYNDFDGQKGSVRNIKEVFQEVFTKLQAGDGFEGKFREFFQNHIGHLKQSFIITKWEDSELWELAQPQGCRGGGGGGEFDFPLHGNVNDFKKSRGRKALEDKGWLAAAMVLGLMASYPLILKPTSQMAGDLIWRMRGISVPKVQG